MYGIVSAAYIYNAVAVPIRRMVISDSIKSAVAVSVVYGTVIVIPILRLHIRRCGLKDGILL